MILVGEATKKLKEIPDCSIQCVVTSPPYWGLRDYGHGDQLGMEKTPGEYVAKMVAVFREVRRVLRADGTCWVNLGDSYAAAVKGSGGTEHGTIANGHGQATNAGSFYSSRFDLKEANLKPKDLCGIPWRVAFALQDDGWWLRQDIIWHKPNPMPESVTDRCTKSHEYMFLLTKSSKYYFDHEAIMEPSKCYGKDSRSDKGNIRYEGKRTIDTSGKNGQQGFATVNKMRNKRSVWTITTKPYKGAHFAVFPETLVEPCVLAGSAAGDTVLDPFAGSGTTLAVAKRLGRKYVGVELNPEYVPLIQERLDGVTPQMI